MAIAVDARNTGVNTTTTSTASWTHTVGSGLSNTMLLVIVMTNQPAADGQIPSTVIQSIDVSGSGMSREIRGQFLTGTSFQNVGIDIWFLRGVTAGSKTITVTVPAGVLVGVAGGSISFSGVNQTNSFLFSRTGPLNTSFNPATNPTDTITSVSGGWLANGIAAACFSPTVPTVGSGQTEIFNYAPGGIQIAAGSDEVATGSNVVMDWTGMDVANNHGGCQVSICMNPFIAATDNSIPSFLHKSS